MEKKRSVGITIFVLLTVMFSLFLLYATFWGFMIQYPKIVVLFAIIYLISGYGIFRLREFARGFAIRFTAVIVALCIAGLMYEIFMTPYNSEARAWSALVWVAIAPFLMFGIPFIIYFTRTKVKGHFK